MCQEEISVYISKQSFAMNCNPVTFLYAQEVCQQPIFSKTHEETFLQTTWQNMKKAVLNAKGGHNKCWFDLVQWFIILVLGTNRSAHFACLPYLTHLIQIISSLGDSMNWTEYLKQGRQTWWWWDQFCKCKLIFITDTLQQKIEKKLKSLKPFFFWWKY